MIRRPPRSTLFPTRRSSDLVPHRRPDETCDHEDRRNRTLNEQPDVRRLPPRMDPPEQDRKSTRLNSSHLVISYAVFCLKKKNKASMTWSMFRPLHILSKARV